VPGWRVPSANRVLLAVGRRSPPAPVSKLLGFIGATLGGYVGWWLGAPVGTMTAFAVSIVGTGVGVYAGRRLAQHFGG